MASVRKGTPVAVTGIGVVTSLGIGVVDNWRKLTGGESGIRRISRFPTDALRTTIAGTVDFVPIEPFCSVALTERLADIAAEEAVTQASVGAKGDFPGPLFVAVCPVEIEWPHREAVRADVHSNGDVTYDDLLRATTSGRFRPFHERLLMASVADH